jgi:hypothetical protein
LFEQRNFLATRAIIKGLSAEGILSRWTIVVDEQRSPAELRRRKFVIIRSKDHDADPAVLLSRLSTFYWEQTLIWNETKFGPDYHSILDSSKDLPVIPAPGAFCCQKAMYWS